MLKKNVCFVKSIASLCAVLQHTAPQALAFASHSDFFEQGFGNTQQHF
jgi:hypothetical protein